jgi:FMN phosphatase YigB (HAD superfamily)
LTLDEHAANDAIAQRWLAWRRAKRSGRPIVVVLDLERRYERGPLFELVTTWPNRLWILSNHRTVWLTERLERFAVRQCFDDVLV